MKREDLKGIDARRCPAACTPEHCVISTVNICKHPLLTGESGCGPITVANRETALKVIKVNAIEGGEHAEQVSVPARVRRDVVDGGGKKKVTRRRKKANAGRGRKRVPARGQGPENQPSEQARQEEEDVI